MNALDGLDGIDEINDQGNLQEVTWRGDPQALLAALISRTRITLFEVARPSLHDIFVRIASPDDERPGRECPGGGIPCILISSKIGVVASTEFGSAIRTKSFLIMLLLLPVIMGGSILLQLVVAKRVDTKARKVAVIDHTGDLYPAIEKAVKTLQFPVVSIPRARRSDRESSCRRSNQERTADPSLILELSDRIRRGELDAFLVIPDGTVQPTSATGADAADAGISLRQSQRRRRSKVADRDHE